MLRVRRGREDPHRRNTRTPSTDSSYDHALDYKPPANERNPNTDDRQLRKGDELLSAQKNEFRRRKKVGVPGDGAEEGERTAGEKERWDSTVAARFRRRRRESSAGSVAAKARAARR